MLIGVKENLQSVNASFLYLQKSPKWIKFYKLREKAIPQSSKKYHTDKKDLASHGHKKLTKLPSADKQESSNSEQEVEEEKLFSRSQRMKNGRKGNRLRYGSLSFMGVEQSPSMQEDEEEELESLLSKYSPNSHEMAAEALCVLILDLLQEVCLQDLNQTSPSKVLSSMLLPHLLHVFTNLYPSSGSGGEDLLASDWTKQHSIYFQRKLLRVVFVMSGIAATQQNGVNVILGHKVLPVLLEVARQLDQMEHLKEELSVSKKRSSAEMSQSSDEFVLFSEIILGLLTTLDVIFQCLPFNLVVIKNAVQLVEEFDDSHGFDFLQHVIHTLDSSQRTSIILARLDMCLIEPVKLIGSFLNTAKSLKINYIHAMKCMRRKHKNCHFSEHFDHHHNILGMPFSMEGKTQIEYSKSSTQLHTSTCLVASWSAFLLDLLPKVKTKVIQIEVLKTLTNSGVCCCFKLDAVIQPILQSIHLFTPGVQNFALDSINQVILKSFGGADKNIKPETDAKVIFKCLTCSDRALHSSMDGTRKNSNLSKPGMDSGFSSHDFQPSEVPEKVLTSKWSVLEEFRSLIFSKDQNVAEATARYLFHLVLDASQTLREELFYRVYMFAFESFLGKLNSSTSTSQTNEAGNDWFSSKVKVHCLSALPHLLQVESVHHTFLTRGVGKICHMLNDDHMRAPVLKVFEALVILDDHKVKEFELSSEFTPDSKASSSGLVIKAFVGGLLKKTKFDIQHSSACSGKEADKKWVGSSEQKAALKDLSLMVDMWEMCAKICLRSEELVIYLQKASCTKLAEDMIMCILKQILTFTVCKYEVKDNSDDSGQEQEVAMGTPKQSVCFLKLALLQALLVVCNASYKQQGKEVSRRLMKGFIFLHTNIH